MTRASGGVSLEVFPELLAVARLEPSDPHGTSIAQIICMKKNIVLKSFISIVFCFSQFTFASNEKIAAESEKMRAVQQAYLGELGFQDRAPDEVACQYMNTFVRQLNLSEFHNVSVYSCAPAPFPGLNVTPHIPSHFTWASLLIEYDQDLKIARLHTAFVKGPKYIAFAYRKDGLLHGSYVVPLPSVETDIAATQLAKLIFLNTRNITPTPFNFVGIYHPSNQGLNLPWNNWNVSNVEMASQSSFRELGWITAGIDTQPIDGPTPVKFSAVPLALLDENGRVLEGAFPLGELYMESPVAEWKTQVSTPAQVRWAAPFFTPENVVSPVELLDDTEKNLSDPHWANFNWATAPGSPEWESLLALGSHVQFVPVESSTLGQTSGPQVNPRYKYVVHLIDPTGTLSIKLIFQHNLNDLLERTITFGVPTSQGLFGNGGSFYDEHAAVVFGVGGVNMGALKIRFERPAPRGSMIIHSMVVAASGALESLDATLEFDLPGWNATHPPGHVVARINGNVTPSCSSILDQNPTLIRAAGAGR